MKLRLAPGDEKRFLAQLSTEARDSSTLMVADGEPGVEVSKSKTEHTV